jgi:Cdc6-related protein, AAA superfamily ATPase
VPSFVTVDARVADSEFGFYQAVLDGVVTDAVPKHGVGTSELRERVHDRLAETAVGVVVAVDHVGEPGSLSAETLTELFATLPSTVSWLAVGRAPPDEVPLTQYTARSIRIDRYGRQALVDVLTARADDGTARRVLAYDHARRIAEWADGNAHHALSAAFVAVDRARVDGRASASEADVTAAIRAVPRESVSLGRVLALPENKRRVLATVVSLDPTERTSVSATTDAVVADPSVDLSAATVRRFLYELAETGVLERVQTEGTGKGRPPSRVEVRFPATVFRRLTDRQ